MASDNVFPIGYVSKQTGLTPHVIRAWERRYGVTSPQRSETNRRLYAQADIDRLALMKRAVDAGHRISLIARLEQPDLKRLDPGDVTGVGRIRTPSALEATGADKRRYLDRALAYVLDLDPGGLKKTLSEAAVRLPQMTLLTGIITPLLEKIGDRWAEGSLRIVQEHVASAEIQSVLRDLIRHGGPEKSAPTMVVATPPGQWCELGALMAAVVAMDRGWQALYLGPNLPVEEIAAAAIEKKAGGVALSVAVYPDERWMLGELSRLKDALPDEVSLFAGGRGVDGLSDRLKALRFEVPPDLKSFAKVISVAAEASS
jgi:DNA-binding transcriptional MerR regulator/methylmalonyl-CoA mutase cobalamin-binding subunit